MSLSDKIKVWRPIDGKCYLAEDVKEAVKELIIKVKYPKSRNLDSFELMKEIREIFGEKLI